LHIHRLLHLKPFPYTTLFRSVPEPVRFLVGTTLVPLLRGPGSRRTRCRRRPGGPAPRRPGPSSGPGAGRCPGGSAVTGRAGRALDRKSTRLNSSHVSISYAVV